MAAQQPGKAVLQNIYGAIPNVTRGKALLLGGDPKGKNIVFAAGNSIFIRNIQDPLQSDMYSEHIAPTTVARYSPSGFYIASGDAAGAVRIWDTTQKEHILKIELKLIAGPITDLQWSDDSKRLVAVGEGKEKYGAVVLFDSGSSVGEISGHTKPITTCDFKQTRPYRIATGSEDCQVNWFEGPPFKFKSSLKDHQKFVNCVRFSPDGNKLATVGSDKMGFFYDGKTGEVCGKLNPGQGHNGGIYCVSWSPDSKCVLTASADKTAKMWDANTGDCIKTFNVSDAPTVDHQLFGCLWQGNDMIAVGLTGEIYCLDPENPNKPRRVIRGHNKNVTAMTYNAASGQLYSSGYDGTFVQWDVKTGHTEGFKGKGHSSEVARLLVWGDNLYSCARDDSVRITSLASREYNVAVAVEGCPVDMCAGKKSGYLFVATMDSVVVIKGNNIVSRQKMSYQPSSIAISTDETLVAVGGKDFAIRLYAVAGDKLTEKATLKQHRGAITTLEFNQDGVHLAAGDSNREIIVWNVKDAKVAIEGWVFHNACVNSIAWSPDGQYLASGSLDTFIYVWSLKNPDRRIAVKDAHRGGVKVVAWVDDRTLVSCGNDCAVKSWAVTY